MSNEMQTITLNSGNINQTAKSLILDDFGKLIGGKPISRDCNKPRSGKTITHKFQRKGDEVIYTRIMVENNNDNNHDVKYYSIPFAEIQELSSQQSQ